MLQIKHIRSVNTKASYENNLSLFGDEIDEVEEIVLDDVEGEESDNANLLSEIIISCSLSCSENSSPPNTTAWPC